MATRKSEWLASIKPILDRDEAKKDAKELARELGDILEINIDANPESLKQLIDEFNKQLSKMGKQPIVFSEKTLHGIVGQFANAVAEGFAKGADTGVAEALKRQLEGLKKQRQEIVKEQDKINKNVKARRRMETLESFEIETARPLTVNGDVGKEAQKLVKVLYESADQIAQAEEQYGKTSIKYRDAVLDAQEAYNKYLRMQKTLKSMSVSERLSIPKDVRASYDLLGEDRDAYEAAGGMELPFGEDFAAEKILDAFEELSDIFQDFVDKETDFKKQLQQIDAQIDSITKKIQEVGVTDDSTFAYAKDGLKTLQEIEAAYDRISKKKTTRGDHKSIDNVSDALEYTPGSASLATLRNRYNTSLFAGEDWEVQYQWLVKFVKEYEASLARINAEENKTDKKNHLATLKKYTELYNSVKPIAAEAEASLLEVAKKAGYQSDKYSGDVGSGDVVDAQAAQKAREEADKKAEAEKRAEESLRRQRIEEEKIAKAKEKQRLEEERIDEARRKAAEDAERERRDGLPAGNAVEGNSAGRNDVTLADIAQDLGGKEKFAYLNTETGNISAYIEGAYEGVAKSAMKELLRAVNETMNATIHSHPENLAAPSEEDIQSFVSDIDGFKRNFILAGKQLAEIDFSELTREQAQMIADVYKANVIGSADEIESRLLGSPLKDLGVSSIDVDHVLSTISEQLKVRFPELLSDIDTYVENLRALFDSQPITDLTQNELEEVISDKVGSDFKNSNRGQQADIFEISKELIDSVTGVPAMYQQELQNIFRQTVEYLDFDASKIFKLYDIDDFQAQLDASRKRAMDGSSVSHEETKAYRDSATAISEEAQAQAKLNEAKADGEQIPLVDDDNIEVIQKENGVLKDKLELLRDIAEQYGNNITQKQRDRYEELNQKDMNEGLTAKEDDRYWELGEQIDEADSALEEFKQTYDRIIVKLANGKKVEILPDDKGSRTLAKINEEYGESYNGVEIEDVIYERIQKDATAAEQVVDSLNDSIEETKVATQSVGNEVGTGTGDASSIDIESLRRQLEVKDAEIAEANRKREEAEMAERVAQEEANAERHATEVVSAELDELQEQKNRELEAKDAEIAQIRETSATQLEAVKNEKVTLQNDLDLARQQVQTAQDEATASQAREAEISKKLAEQENLNRQLRESLANVKTDMSEGQASVSSEELKSVLSSITYGVKIVHEDVDKNANKIAIDESALEQILNKVFTNILSPHTEQTSIEPKNGPWALESTLSTTIKGVLDQIQINTAKVEQEPQMPPDDIDSALTQISKNIAEINSKIVKGAKAITKDTIKSQETSVNRDAQILTERIETQKLALKKFKTELETSGRMTDEMSKKIRGLAISLGMVKNNKDLTRWGQKFQQQKLSVGITDIGNKESISDQNANIKEWISLSKKLGELDTKINSGLFDDTIILQAKQEREFVLKRIDDLMELINNPNSGFIAAGEANFAGHYDTIGAQRSKLVGRLVSKYDRLGELKARAETSGAFEDREKYSQLEKEIQAEVEKLRLNEEQNAELLKILQERQEIAYINAKDIEYAKEQKRLFAEYANLVKQIGKLDGVINSDTADEISRLNAQIEKDALMRLVDDIRPNLDLTREDLISVTATNMQGEETSTVYQRQTALTNLAKQYKELGKLQAQGAHTQVAELQKKIDAQRIVLKLTQEEQDALTQIAENARQDALNKRKDQDAKKMAQREAMLGKAWNAVGRAENTWMNAIGIEGELPADFAAKIDEYYQKLDALRKKHQELKNSDMISDEQKKELLAQTLEINKLTDEIRELVSEYQKLSGDNVTVIGQNKLDSDAGLDAYKQQLKQAVMTATNGKAQIKNFDAATGTLTYTVKTGAYEFTEYTAAVRRADGALVSVQGATKKTETFFEATARKMKELTSYFSGMAVFNRIGQELRRGIQYIREIDLALTELKKVTNETTETYDKFLKTAAKTADKTGSTMTNIISSTADWIKLGNTLADAASLAETTSVLLNVSEFESIDSATSALVSTMQAFGYAAKDSMSIVDVMNEIGNNYAVSSDGIATALQDSASALVTANNSYEEAVAMIAAGNRVIQDPSSLGSGLRTIALRLRGTSVEGEDDDGLITSTSKLQSKIKALSGVDILTDTGAYKSTYQILLEISDVWEQMSDIDQAALLEIIAGKNRSNVAAALLSNSEDLRAALESAQNAEGK